MKEEITLSLIIPASNEERRASGNRLSRNFGKEAAMSAGLEAAHDRRTGTMLLTRF